MQIIQLYIEGQRVDMFKDESVSITQSIKNVKDLDKIFTDFTKTFSIPASKTNNKIFKHYYNFDITNGFDARIKKDANLELNYLPFKTGKIKLEGVDLKDNKAHTYRVTFFGNTVKLKDLLGDDKLQSLSDLDVLTKVYDANNIRNGLQLNPDANDVIVPLITHTKRLFYEDGQHGEGTGNLWYESGSGTSHHHGVLYSELKYAIRLHKIVEAIETKYGITFSDDFFVSSNAPYYDLFMWLHRKKGDVQNLSGVNQTLVDGWTPTSKGLTETQMINNSTIRVTGNALNYDRFSLKLEKTTGLPYRVVIYKDGEENYRSDEFTGDLTIAMSLFDLAKSDYTVYIESESALTFTNIYWDILYSPFNAIFSDTYNTGTFNYFNSFNFIITQEIPEMRVIDFLKGLFKMFNLIAYVDTVTDEIIVKSLDAFYISGVSYDITKYIDINKSASNVALPYREVSFSYEDTGTLLAKRHNQLAGKEWAKTNYKGEDGNLDGGLYSIELPFGHLKNERLIDLNNDTNTGIMYGFYVDDNQESYIGKPLLFYPIRQAGEEVISFLNSESEHVPVSTYNIPSNSLSINSTTSKVNINFNNEFNEYTSSNDFTNTLFEVYYKKYITSVFNPKNRISKVTAYLPLRILLNYSLADRFIINGNSYKINSITTNLENGKSELELLNDL